MCCKCVELSWCFCKRFFIVMKSDSIIYMQTHGFAFCRMNAMKLIKYKSKSKITIERSSFLRICWMRDLKKIEVARN